MKHLNDILNEGILDVDKNEEGMDDMVDRHQIWKDLTETYGPMLRGYDKFGCTVDNIAFDKKGRIIFVNWPMDTVDFDMQIDSMPDSVLKRGFGKFTKDVYVYGLWGAGTKGCKLSSLGFVTRSETKLSIRGGKVEFDECPKFNTISFYECFITNPMKLPKIQPKKCTITFNDGTVNNITYMWAREYFKTSDVHYGDYSDKIRISKY